MIRKKRTVGVLGLPARDTKIFHDGKVSHSLGGILFTAAAAGVLNKGGQTELISRFGTDIEADAKSILSQARCGMRWVSVTHVQTQHSCITFQSYNLRTERIEGGLAPLEWHEIVDALSGLDILCINHITGQDISLETAQRIKKNFAGPVVMDYHSLALTTYDDGSRHLYRRSDWKEWIGTADLVQMNLEEAQTLAGRTLVSEYELKEFAQELLELGPQAAVITLAQDGAFGLEEKTEPGAKDRYSAVRIGATEEKDVADTVGCGDVFLAALALNWQKESGSLSPAVEYAVNIASAHTEYTGLSGIFMLAYTA